MTIKQNVSYLSKYIDGYLSFGRKYHKYGFRSRVNPVGLVIESEIGMTIVVHVYKDRITASIIELTEINNLSVSLKNEKCYFLVSDYIHRCLKIWKSVKLLNKITENA